MTFNEFFDIHNNDHLRALRCLINTGQWPNDFIPENVVFVPDWDKRLCQRITLRWISSRLMFDDQEKRDSHRVHEGKGAWGSAQEQDQQLCEDNSSADRNRSDN